MIGVEIAGSLFAMLGSGLVLMRLQRDDGLFRAWLVFMLALMLALMSMLAAVLEFELGIIAGPRIVSNVLWGYAAVRFALQLSRAGLGDPMEGRWATLTYGVLGITTALVGLYLWLGLDSEGARIWKLRQLVGILADAVVLNACVQVLRFVWPMRAGQVARPYAFFIVAALAFIARGLLAQLGAPVGVDMLVALLAWSSVVAAAWQQARLTWSLV